MLFEVATDKVDSEIPSPVDGVVSEILFPEETVVSVGTVVAVINTGGDDAEQESREADPAPVMIEGKPESKESEVDSAGSDKSERQSGRFYSPLVMTIAREENIPFEELDKIAGTGFNGRVRKSDILEYLPKGKGKPKLQPGYKS